MTQGENVNLSNSQTGGGGALFARADNLRSDARMAAQMISLGVIELEEAKELLKLGFGLAKAAALNGNERGFAACMKIGIEVAKLEQSERHKLLDKLAPDKIEHAFATAPPVTLEQLHADPDYVRYLDQESTETNRDPGCLCHFDQQGDGERMADGSTPGDPESEPS